MQMNLGLWPQLKGQNSKNPPMVKPGNMIKLSHNVTLSESDNFPILPQLMGQNSVNHDWE